MTRLGFEILTYQNKIQMKKEIKQQNSTDTQMGYYTVLPAVNNEEECEDWYEDDEDWYEDDEDYYYQCMVCGKAQEKFNGGSCLLCAGPVDKITF